MTDMSLVVCVFCVLVVALVKREVQRGYSKQLRKVEDERTSLALNSLGKSSVPSSHSRFSTGV